MKYETFSRIWSEAKEDYEDFETFFGKRGWQPWMEEFTAGENVDKVIEAMKLIWEVAKNPKGIVEVLKKKYSKIVTASRLYDIPYRTISDWKGKLHAPPEYIVKLICFAEINDLVVCENEK